LEGATGETDNDIIEDWHPPLENSQRKTYVLPAIPVKALFYCERWITMFPPAPLTIVHNPVKGDGSFPLRVVPDAPHKDWSGPALAAGGQGMKPLQEYYSPIHLIVHCL
jgi:hypothetical protein